MKSRINIRIVGIILLLAALILGIEIYRDFTREAHFEQKHLEAYPKTPFGKIQLAAAEGDAIGQRKLGIALLGVPMA